MLKPGIMVKVKFPNMTIDCKVISSTNTSVSVDYKGVRLQVDMSSIIMPADEQPFRPSPDEDQLISNKKDVRLISKRKSIESLRYGLVPNEAIQEMTLRFEELKSWVVSRLPEENGWCETVSQICGSYGTGKSHTMSVIRYLASIMGYASIHVEINGKDITLEAPDTLSAHLWKTLEAEGLESDTPLLNLYVKAIEKGKSAPCIAPQGIDRTRDNYKTISLLRARGLLDQYSHYYESVLCSFNDITASDLQVMINNESNINVIFDNPKVRKIIGMKVVDRPYDFVESLNGTALICQLAGYKGLVVTIDEFEVQRFSIRQDRVKDLIKVLIQYLKGKTNHKRAPLSIFFATVGQDGNLGDKIIDMLIDFCEGSNHILQEFEEDDCIEIGEKIFNLYREVYTCSGVFDHSVAQHIYSKVKNMGGHVRQFVKHYIANLDREYGPPETVA